MAAFEDTSGADLDQFEGKQWKEWLNATNHTKNESTSKKSPDVGEVSKLKRLDMTLFGYCPSRDGFYLVVCDYCNQPIKPQSLRTHIEKYHKSKKISIPTQLVKPKVKNKSKKDGSHKKNHKINSQSHEITHSQICKVNEAEKNQHYVSGTRTNVSSNYSNHVNSKDSNSSINKGINVTIHNISTGHPVAISHGSSKHSHNLNKEKPRKHSSVATSPNVTSNSNRVTLHTNNAQERTKHKHHRKESKEFSKVLKMSENDEKSVEHTEERTSSKSKRNYVSHHHHLHQNENQSDSGSASDNSHFGTKNGERKSSDVSSNKKRHSSDASISSSQYKLSARPPGSLSMEKATIANSPLMPKSTLPPPTKTVKKNIPLKDRQYDPNKHCGVKTSSGDVRVHCTRSLTCKIHPLSAKRNVQGRRKPYDQLLSEHSHAKNKIRQNTSTSGTDSDSSSSNVQSTPKSEFLTPTPPVSKVRANTSKSKTVKVSSPNQSFQAVPSKPKVLPVSLIPKLFSPWHVDCWDSDTESTDDEAAVNPALTYLNRHPTPLTVPSYGIKKQEGQVFVKFNRRMDKIKNGFLCKTSPSVPNPSKKFTTIHPKFSPVSNASYTLSHINHSIGCISQNFNFEPGLYNESIKQSQTFMNPNEVSNITDLINPLPGEKVMQLPKSTPVTKKNESRTKSKATKRKSSMSDINNHSKNTATQNNLLRNRSKSVNLSKIQHTNHEIHGIAQDVNNTVLKSLLSSNNIQLQDYGQRKQIIYSSNSASSGNTSFANQNPTLSQAISNNSIRTIPQSSTKMDMPAQKRNAKGQFINMVAKSNHVFNHVPNIKPIEHNDGLKSEEPIHINGLAVSSNNDLLKWRPSVSLSAGIGNLASNNPGDIGQDDLDTIIQQTV